MNETMDLTISLAAQPAMIKDLVSLFSNTNTYGFLVVVGALVGGTLRVSLPDLNPLSLLGVLLLAASTFAPVPLILGLGVLGVWLSLSAGAQLGSSSMRALRNGVMVRKVRGFRAFKLAHAPALFLLTASGRSRAATAAFPLLALGTILMALGLNQCGAVSIVLGLAGFTPYLRITRRLLWANARQIYRRSYATK